MATFPHEPVTAVVCCFNGDRYLSDLLRSIEAQSAPVVETILVDNASTDGSRERVRREFPRVRIVEMARNDGPCSARNRGMAEASTRLVFAVDCDVTLAPDCLERCLAAHAADPGLALVEPRAVDERDRALIQYDGAAFHYVGLLALRNFYARAEAAPAPARAVAIDAFVSVAVLADREKLIAAGGYDPRFFILFEDNDLAYRLRSAGERAASAEDAIVVHRGGTAGTSFRDGSYPARRVFLHARNRWLFLVKSYQLATLLRGAPGLLLYEIAAIVFACAKLAPHAYVAGKLAFLMHLPAALAARRHTARRRRVPDREFVRGGPLTLWPPLTAGRATAAAGRFLDRMLRAWWRFAGGRA